jgi:hypothetical protein
MKFRDDERKDGWDRLKNECEGENGEIDSAQDYPAVTVHF